VSRYNDDSPPQEDELMDRCQEFCDLITHRGLKDEKDALFQFIIQATRLRAEEELVEEGMTDWPLLQEVVPATRLREEGTVFTGEQEIFVNKVLQVLKNKNAVSMGGSKYA